MREVLTCRICTRVCTPFTWPTHHWDQGTIALLEFACQLVLQSTPLSECNAAWITCLMNVVLFFCLSSSPLSPFRVLSSLSYTSGFFLSVIFPCLVFLLMENFFFFPRQSVKEGESWTAGESSEMLDMTITRSVSSVPASIDKHKTSLHNPLVITIIQRFLWLAGKQANNVF